MPAPVYLDHNATTPLKPQALAVMMDALKDGGNASSVHFYGRKARKYVEAARLQIATALDVGPQQVVFNSGATEGNNTILKGFTGKRILVSGIEHPSVIDAGVAAEQIPVLQNGTVNLAALETMLAEGDAPALISVMMVNNETGVIQPVSEISKLAKTHGAFFHTDAVQAFGRVPFTRQSIGADFVTISSHKIGGPQGAGAIIFAAKSPLPKLIHGGGQERRQRAGTENIAAIAGFGMAAELAITEMAEYQRLGEYRDRIENELKRDDRVRLYGADASRVSNTISFSMRGFPAETQLMQYDLAGVAVSSGSACSSGSVKPSHVLMSMGADEDTAKSAIRVSMGWNTTSEDIDRFIEAWNNIRGRD